MYSLQSSLLNSQTTKTTMYFTIIITITTTKSISSLLAYSWNATKHYSSRNLKMYSKLSNSISSMIAVISAYSTTIIIA